MNLSIDIIVFAVIAAVLLWRLRSVLGERQEDEPKNLNIAEQLRALQQNGGEAKQAAENGKSGAEIIAMLNDGSRWAQELPNYAVVSTATAHNHLAQLLTVDPSFRPDQFLVSAQKAFTMIIEAFSNNARTTLEFLVAPPLLQRFMNQLDVRDERKESYHVQFFGIKQAVIEDAELSGTTARITVHFTAEQAITHKDADGQFMNDNDGRRRTTQDRWIFQKDLKDPSPSWLLVAALDPIDD